MEKDETEAHETDAILDVLRGMNHKTKIKKNLPTPEQQPLTDTQKKILDRLPAEPGFYWVENMLTNERNIAYIDKNSTERTVEHWGHRMQATYGGINAIERWLMNWDILTIIEPYKDPVQYEESSSYGMF